MIRRQSDRVLRWLARAEPTATALAVVLAVLVVADALGSIDAPYELLYAGLGLVLVGWIVGRNADGELLRRAPDPVPGHWPTRAEREAEPVLDVDPALRRPTPVDDEGNPTERNP